MSTIFTQNDNLGPFWVEIVVILWIFWTFVKQFFLFQLEKNHVTQLATAKNKRKCSGSKPNYNFCHWLEMTLKLSSLLLLKLCKVPLKIGSNFYKYCASQVIVNKNDMKIKFVLVISYSYMRNKIRRIQLIFDNPTWKPKICNFWQLRA